MEPDGPVTFHAKSRQSATAAWPSVRLKATAQIRGDLPRGFIMSASFGRFFLLPELLSRAAGGPPCTEESFDIFDRLRHGCRQRPQPPLFEQEGIFDPDPDVCVLADGGLDLLNQRQILRRVRQGVESALPNVEPRLDRKR